MPVWLQLLGKCKAQVVFDRSCVERVPQCPVIHVISSRGADPWMVRSSTKRDIGPRKWPGRSSATKSTATSSIIVPCLTPVPRAPRQQEPGRPRADPNPFIPSDRAIDDTDLKDSVPGPGVNDWNKLQPPSGIRWYVESGRLRDRTSMMPDLPVAASGRKLLSGRCFLSERTTRGQRDDGVPRERVGLPQQIRSVRLPPHRKHDLSVSAVEQGSDPVTVGWRLRRKCNLPF